MDHFSISHTCRGHLLVPHCNTIVKSRRELQPTAGDTPKYVLHRSVVQHMVLMGRCDISRAPSVIVDSLAGGELLHGWFMHLLNCAELVEGSYVIVAWGLRHFLFKMTYSSLSVLWARFIAAQPLAEAAPGLDCHYDIISTQEVRSFLYLRSDITASRSLTHPHTWKGSLWELFLILFVDITGISVNNNHMKMKKIHDQSKIWTDLFVFLRIKVNSCCLNKNVCI